MEFMFKDHYRWQMSQLVENIIADAGNPGFPPMVLTTREANLKKQMDYIRGLANSWDDLTDKCVNGSVPHCVMIKDVLDMMCESRSEIGIIDVLCMFAYVSDVCTELVLNSKHDVDIDDDVARIV